MHVTATIFLFSFQVISGDIDISREDVNEYKPFKEELALTAFASASLTSHFRIALLKWPQKRIKCPSPPKKSSSLTIRIIVSF